MSAKRQNHAINAIRTLSAFVVVLTHVRTLFFVDFSQSDAKDPVTQALYLAGSFGHPAVIVFFVLSGFWVGNYIIRRVGSHTLSIGAYANDRLVRLWIVLLPALLLTQILDRVGFALHPDSAIYVGSAAYHNLMPASGAVNQLGLLDTLGNIFFVQSLHVPTLGTDSPLWSIAYEFWYYVLFLAVMVVFLPRFQIRVRIAAAAVAILSAVIAGPSVLALFPSWLLGALLAWQLTRATQWVQRLPRSLLTALRSLSILGVILAAAASVYLDANTSIEDSIVALFAFAMLFLFLNDTSSTSPSRFVVRPLSAAAQWSYSLYAIHVPILAFVAAVVVTQPQDRWQMAPPTILMACLLILLVATSAWAFHLITEKRTNMVRDFMSSRIPVLRPPKQQLSRNRR